MPQSADNKNRKINNICRKQLVAAALSMTQWIDAATLKTTI
jgi:hypothetical protein